MSRRVLVTGSALDPATEPLVSVIMPFHDTPREFIEEAVESVLGQTDPRWELLIVDDGSAPAAAKVAQEVAARDPRIRYLEHEGHVNRGASASRNLGIRSGRAKYVAFLDADDVWLPRKVEEQVALIEEHPGVGMLYGNTEYWHSWTGVEGDADRDYFPRLGVRAESIHLPPILLTKYLRGDAAVPCTCSVIVRREVGDRVGWFDESFERVYTDQVFYARVCLEAPVYVSGACWDRYRQRTDSSCSTAERTGEMREARLAFLTWLFGYLEVRKTDDRKLSRALAEQLASYEPDAVLGIPGALREVRRRTRKWGRRLFGGVFG